MNVMVRAVWWSGMRELGNLVIALFRSMWSGLHRLALVLVPRAAASAVRQQHASGTDPRIAHGIDCACYFSTNFYVRSPVEGHFTFVNEDIFSREYASLLEELTEPDHKALVANLETEAERRRSQAPIAAQRKARIVAEYTPLHPQLWTLEEAWLHPEFIRLVQGARRADGMWRPPPAIAQGVYVLPVFSTRFCELLCEELDAFGRSGLPCGRPNSMNRLGTLLDELGLSPGLIDPLVRDYLRPLAAALPPLAAVGGSGLDHHKSFVVAYRMGEDEDLAQHFDNAEITLNTNLGIAGFEGGELVFHGHKDRASSQPVAFHEWSEKGNPKVGHGVLHLGAQVHAALPITCGERRNLVVWMRSTMHRQRAGCPMCGRSDALLPSPCARIGLPSAGEG